MEAALPPLPEEAWLYFRDQLRRTRARALADAEDFHDILFALERLGAFLKGAPGGGLSDYKEFLVNLAAKAGGKAADGSSFGELFEIVRVARNDAMHTGAFARHLTLNAVRLALLLEEALMHDARFARHFMVPAPTTAALWQPLGIVRETMLANSFSYLPVFHEGAWKLLADAGLAHHLQPGGTKERKARLASLLGDALKAGAVELEVPLYLHPESPIDAVFAPAARGRPCLVVTRGGPDQLVGIITAFDLL